MTKNILTRRASRDDDHLIHSIHRKTQLRMYRGALQSADNDPWMPWRQDGLDGAREDFPEPVVLVSAEDTQLAGYLSMGITNTPDGQTAGEIYQLRVIPEFRNRGHGRCLLRDAESLLRESGVMDLYYWIPEPADKAMRFVIRNGFKSTNEFRMPPDPGIIYPDLRFHKDLRPAP